MTGNVCDYLEWYGDFGFDVLPFNEVDNLALSLLSYGKFDGLVPAIGENGSISVNEAAAFFEDKANYGACDKIELCAVAILFAMKNSKRYGEAKLFNYFVKHDFKAEEQFAALHISLPDGTRFVSFSGTDDTLLGWKEDFNMAYISPAPGQLEATKYVADTCAGNDRLRIGGHSKGGNLAVYAAIHSTPDIRNRIINVYSNDGPGFVSEVIEKPEYNELLDRIVTIVPETSIVGMLLEHREKYKVVKSYSKGIGQHDGITWRVYKAGFIELDERSKSSLMIDDTISSWLKELSSNEREEFINTIFEVCDRANITKLSEFSKLSIMDVGALLKEMITLTPETKKAVKRIISAFIRQSGRVVKEFRNA